MTAVFLGLALVGTTAIGVAGASSRVARKAPAPSITVTPAKGLHNHQKVEITGKNFPAKTDLVIVECNPLVLKNNPSACAETHLGAATTSSTGTFPKTSFVVLTGAVGNGSCGTTTKNLTCYIFVSKPSVTSTVDADSAIRFSPPAPSITVTPAKGLHKNQKVEITGKNFPPKTGLVIVECNPLVLKNNPSACAVAHLGSTTTGSTGTFPKTSFAVIAGTVGNGSCGTTAKNLTCYIFVSKPSVTSTVEADSAITFAKP